MIYVRLMGGLGNQMFQYAAGRRLALARKTHLALDRSYFENQVAGDVPREFELDCFDLRAKQILEPAENLSKKRFLLKTTLTPTPVREKGHSFDPAILDEPDNVLLIGYWQTEKYFKDYEEVIRQDFVFIKSLSKQKQIVARQISESENSVGLQIRRGDYASHPASMKFHGLVPLEYYAHAVNQIARKIKSPKVFVISDDHEWCQANLKFDYPPTFVKHVPGTGQEDMNLMSQCRHQIIANSSFGWWAAWLNSNPKKIVIGPKNWFKEKSVDASDMIPSGWIRL